MLNRPEEALSHLNTAARLMPSSHQMWTVKTWQSIAYRELGRWAEGNAAVDESISLIPTWSYNHVYKAYLCVQLGHDDLSRKHIEMARKLGAGLTDAERFWRRIVPNSPTLESAVGTIRALYAATEPGA
jgi:tetratricopeptide (TPR) repeat protein